MQNRFRNIAWRLGRKLYCWGRRDVPNSPDSNGEYWLLDRFIDCAAESAVLLDVGAHKGDWSRRALELASSGGKAIQLHAFEPSASTREILQRNLGSCREVEVHALALSSTEGEADFFSNGIGSGTNSLSSSSGTDTERVKLSTVDGFIQQRKIESIGMMKIDTEGFDLEVLRGAESSLASGSIELVQFEYNWRWLLNKASLREVFDLIAAKPYRFGKLVGEGMVFHNEWHFELDRYFENNYVLVRSGSAIERFGCAVAFDERNVAVQVVEP